MSDAYLPSASAFVADHVRRYEATNGEDGGLMDDGTPVMILSTVGRRTGAVRKTPLIRVEHDTGYVAVASLGGAPSHPSWYLNLVATPDVTVQDGADVLRMTARTAAGAERNDLWRSAVAVWPDFDQYQAQTERLIPVVVLER